ncbi:MAG: diguanylate cyclase [Mariprofundaceae bacterium]
MTLRMKRWWFTVGASALMIVIFSIVIIQAFNYFSLNTIREQGRMAAEMLRITLTEQMRDGVIEDRDTLFKRMRTIPGLVDVRVLRGEPVIHQFGPGFDSERPKLDMEKRVLATGNWEESFVKSGDEAVYRITIPYIARSAGGLNCMECHKVPEGSINGAVTLGFSLENMRRSEILSIAPVVFLLLLFGLALGYFLKRLFRPMVETAENMKSVVESAREGDFSGRITISAKDEIGEIAEHTNALMETLDQSIGKISTYIGSLGEYNQRQADHNQLDHTVHIVEEMVGATRFKQAIENDLDLDEIYARISRVLKNHFELTQFAFYQVESDSTFKLMFAEGLEDGRESWCDPAVQLNSEICRAKRSAANVSSLNDPEMCSHFCSGEKNNGGFVYACVPIMLSGSVGGVLQMVLTPEEAEKHSDIEQTVNIYLKEAAPVIEARQLMRSLKESAMRDPMTGLYNRRFLEEYIDTLTANMTRNKSSLGILMCDIDFFKQVNDEYGHDIGDQVIKGLSDVLVDVVRASDIAIRYGGEEFIVLLPDTDADGSMLLAERIRKAMEAAAFQTPQGELKKTLSVGISIFPEEGTGFWQCVKYADIALYQAKERGRNQSLKFSKDMWEEDESY